MKNSAPLALAATPARDERLFNLTRRKFLHLAAAGAAGSCLWFSPKLFGQEAIAAWDPAKPLVNPARKLRVRPVLMYSLPTPKAESSWKSWGGVQTEAALTEEAARIEQELRRVAASVDFPLEIQPLIKVNRAKDAQQLRELGHDVTLVYACTGSGDLLRACLGITPDTLVFVRHRSGPVYYWYEALSVRYLDTTAPDATQPLAPAPSVHVDDVVVDDYAELAWRLRALSAVANLKQTRIVALGGVWGKYSADAPERARESFGIRLTEVSYEDFGKRLARAQANSELVSLANAWADRYLALPGTVLETERAFVVNAFLLYRLFRELMQENEAAAFTVRNCMGTIIPMSKTTACLSLSLLCDEGWPAFCESDFVIIPAGILLRYISGKPVFLHNSTFPHQGIVTCAHCTSPRRLDGHRIEPARIQTHYESEYGAAPKVEMPLKQTLTFLDPEYTTGRWLGFRGTVQDNPSYDVCRSQQDVEIQGNWRQLVREVRDSHWVAVYGEFLREAGYAARKLGIRWVNLTDPA
ncbi:MAG: sugar isomerase [Verrucomicrobiia bacterium]